MPIRTLQYPKQHPYKSATVYIPSSFLARSRPSRLWAAFQISQATPIKECPFLKDISDMIGGKYGPYTLNPKTPHLKSQTLIPKLGF